MESAFFLILSKASSFLGTEAVWQEFTLLRLLMFYYSSTLSTSPSLSYQLSESDVTVVYTWPFCFKSPPQQGEQECRLWNQPALATPCTCWTSPVPFQSSKTCWSLKTLCFWSLWCNFLNGIDTLQLWKFCILPELVCRHPALQQSL